MKPIFLNNMLIKMPVLLFFLLSLFSCNTIDPPSQTQSLSLFVEDVSCIEAWLRIITDKISNEIVIKQNDEEVKRFLPISSDTLIVIDSLLPNQSYTFQAFAVFNNETISASEKATAITMDTTSHNFTWETFEFGGEAGSSSLYDVAIIDENNIWAVGEIYLKDSLGNYDPEIYNAVHWNGVKWEVKRISVDFRGNLITLPLEGIFAFSATDIWVVGSLPMHGNGENWEIYDIRATIDASLSLSKAWGTSSNDMYFVGRGGSIAHYNGNPSVDGWEKINSGTTTNIKDIWGKVNPVTQNKIIYCAVSNVVTSGDYKILSINENNSIDSIPWNTNRRVESIWFEDNFKIFTCGGGVFINDNNLWKEQTGLPLIHTNRIRGQGKNDVFVAGDFGLLAHFNGVCWYVYPDADVALFYSLDYKNNSLVAVGERNGKAIILMMGKQ